MVGNLEKPVVSVVIAAYKSAATIAPCLESLLSQDTSVPYEVIVVESSADGAGELIRERFPEVRLIEWPHRLFLGNAKSTGAESARGSMYLFIDSDCVAEPAWIEKMHRRLASGDGVAVGGAVLNGNPETPVSIAAYISEFSHFFPHGRPRYVNYVTGGNSSFLAEVFWAYGGFDRMQPLYVDLMFNKRLYDAGERILFDPEIVVRHWHRSSLDEHLSHQIGRGRAAAVARRKGALVGRSWVKYPPLALLAAPGLFLRKAAVFPLRYVRAFPGEIGSLIRALPCFWLGMAYWHYGFLKEAFKPAEAQSLRERSA